ncbi:MAG: cyclic nucleotide-binding domain-containing protein, partial [Actinomycetota bacterium]
LATVESTVAELNKAAVVRLMKQSEAFNATMQNLFQDQAIWTYVKSSPLFSKLPEEDVEELTEDAELRVLRPGELIYQEGDPGSDVFLVRSGFLRVARTFGGEQRVLQYFHKGDLCGTAAIVFDQVQSATVSANTRAEVIVIPGASVLELLKEHPEVRPALEAEARESEQLVDHHIGPPPTDRPSHQQMPMEGLLDSGVIQGHYVLAINTSVCVNCNNCVDACERRHGYSRLDRSGLQLGDLLFPTACRHCEDPVCLLCSVNGIVREPGGEVRIVPDNCIGCGACAERCPYGNINMHPREKYKRGAFRTAFEWILGEQEVTLDLHAAEGRGDRVASKCDLCAGYENYACVTACPVGAAMRMDPVEVFGPEVLIGLEAAKRS